MIQNSTTVLKKQIERNVRFRLAQISSKNRIMVVLTMLALFGMLALYMTVSSLYNIGKGRRKMSIERIERLQLEFQTDSLKPIKRFDYE